MSECIRRSAFVILHLSMLAALGGAWPAAAQETHLLVITGVAGDAEHAERFHRWATALIEAAEHRGQVADTNVAYLAEQPETDRAVTGRSTRENVAKAFADLAARCHPDDVVFVVLIGHGSFDGRQAAFNLPGPDLTAADYARLVGKLGSERVVFVNTSSASGAFLEALAAPGRTIVTATKTGGERNETRFPEFFVEAFAREAADKNRDGRVSVLEAFDYARAKVAEAYQQKGLILTEHAALEDGHQGELAATLFLESPRARTAALGAIADPALRALLEQRQALEDQIAALKLRKAQMDPAEYEQTLERLATELALKTREVKEKEKGEGRREGGTDH